MKPSLVALIAAVSLLIGFGAGIALQPVLKGQRGGHEETGSAPQPSLRSDQPTQAEATEAVRRHRVGFTSYPEATLTLGDCSTGGLAPGVTCAERVVLNPDRPNASAQNRSIGFARIDGRWEVSLW